MIIIVFIVIFLISIALIILYQRKDKICCPNCKSTEIVITGNKKYKESPALALWGSPDTYYKYEFRCKNCGHLFWMEQKSIIFN